ncbi:ABC transporter permease [Anaerotruncus rubiinfantis]|uniref:ABC transporter permease n=1 Tax=Anaerotruncus rubiinfantis TaxID=1720200 RepID=UPI00189992B8|nr:ABC transporter permease [Anaerotruncus rubiinfantis]
MKLFATAFYIACKHSGRRLLCLLCVFAVCLGLLGAVFSAVPEKSVPKAEVAIVNLDQNPMSRTLLRSFASMESLSDLFQVSFASPEELDRQHYNAVLTIPDGFLDSVLTGENRSPVLEVDISTPLEAMWVRELAQAGASALTTAQLGVYTVQEAVNYGEGMPRKDYELLLMDVNLTFLKEFLSRLELVAQERLSATGTLSLPLYYAASLCALLFLAYGFLYMPAVRGLKRFAVRARADGMVLFVSAFAHIAVFTAALGLLLFLPACHRFGFTMEKLAAFLLFLLLVSGWTLAICLLTESFSACAAASILLSTGMGLCAGGFLPLALMPAAFTGIAGFLPAGRAIALAGAVLGEPLSSGSVLAAGAMAAAMLLLAWFCWRHKGVA